MSSLMIRNIVAGPATQAEARKRGAIIAEFQKGLDPSPLYKKEVTVCSVRKQSNAVGCEFTKSSSISLDSDLGFYLMV